MQGQSRPTFLCCVMLIQQLNQHDVASFDFTYTYWPTFRNICRFLWQNFKLKLDIVNRNRILSRKILPRASQKGLREVETRQPEDGWFTELEPLGEKV